MVVLITIVVGISLFLRSSNQSRTEAETTGINDESRLLLNQYINFLVNGEVSSDKPDFINFLANNYSILYPTTMFAERIKLDDLELARTYFDDLNSIYTKFGQAFFSPDNETDGSGDAISNYFFEAAKGSYLNLNQIISLYLQDGEDSVRYILANAFDSNSSSETIKQLFNARKKQIGLYINAIAQADKAGCIIDNSLEIDCARPYVEAISTENVELMSLINELEIQLRREAMVSLENIYYEFYPDEMIIEGSNA